MSTKQPLKEQLARIGGGYLLTEANKFTVTITKIAGKYAQGTKDKVIDQQSFTTEPDAKAYVKKMVKQHKLTRQHGFWGNAKTSIELTTNF